MIFIVIRGLDSDWTFDCIAFVSLQSRRLDVLLSLCHDSAPVDVSRAGRERETLRNRNRAFRGVGRNQWSCHLAVPMDRADTRMKRTRLPRMSPKRRREAGDLRPARVGVPERTAQQLRSIGDGTTEG